ncbi:hypothetical protein LG329_15875 [Virgibacillus necropolis]|uniref:hypothetical protein n=1 Tax=Virgibacillus necropolis TaxID=163877 RepID=UPI00384ABA7B
MKKYRTFIVMCVLTCLFVVMSACGNTGNQSKTNNASEITIDSSEANNEFAISTNSSNDNDRHKGNNSDSNGNKYFFSGTCAIEYLKHQLEMENNDDIVFDDLGGNLETDKAGSYYTIKLTSKSLKKQGGTGTVGLYKVYQDGTYKLN